MVTTRRQTRSQSSQPSDAAASSQAPASGKAHVTTEFEFMGPIGTGFMLLGLTGFVYFLCVACNEGGWPNLAWRPSLSELADAWSWQAFGVVCGWFLFQAILYYVAPGNWVKGVKLQDGSQLEYPINAFSALIITVVALTLMHLYYVPLTWLADHFTQVSVATIALAWLLSMYLYIASFLTSGELSHGGNSGYFTYDFFMGRELNPRLLGGTFDLKYFCELRPGLIGWAVLNAAFAMKQAQVQGAVSPAMWLVQAFQAYYVLDALWFERCILTTVDITTDGFGFMLAFGDLAWVPFTYTLQARFLSQVPVHLSLPAIGGILALKALGLYIFRSSNLQKDTFRSTPDAASVKDMEYIQTKRGTRLLADGWWGMARHINYLGDWLMGVAWCLPTGFFTPITYFYAVYFGILLIHRERRDDHKCANKYSKDWEQYRAKVPARIIPGVY